MRTELDVATNPKPGDQVQFSTGWTATATDVDEYRVRYASVAHGCDMGEVQEWRQHWAARVLKGRVLTIAQEGRDGRSFVDESEGVPL